MISRLAILVTLLALTLSGAAFANAPLKSMRPVIRPVQRPDVLVLVANAPGVKSSPRPWARPENLRAGKAVSRKATAQNRPVLVATSKQGSICGVRTIRGQKLSPIPGKLSGCGVQNPVRVASIAGVALTQGAIMDCTTAKALDKWVKTGVKPTIGRLGGGVASLKVAAHYSCRTRNNQPGAKISEHGKGHAIDISAINLKNGSSVTVLKGWRSATQGKLLKKMHRSACGPFGTVLGPNADRYHQDHFHLDTARYRSGSYCR